MEERMELLSELAMMYLCRKEQELIGWGILWC